jgi:formylglycine-generating enzyme required for sulfatase activity
MPLNVGQVLNQRYRIIRLLGQGGFGAVYRAWDLLLERACALKENLDASAEAQRQFLVEAKILAGLSHPNLPRVTDTFFLPGQGQYLVMDFVDGEDLDQKLQRTPGRPLNDPQVLLWVGEVCDALTYLHSQSPPVIHRDIKPANIRITPAGRAMLVDFGLAKRYKPGTKTTQGARAVTEGFSPVEQYGKGATDARSDLYALGATLYTLMTGIEPVESVQRTVNDLLAPAERLNPALSPQVAAVIGRAMQMDPAQRFQNALEFKTALLHPAPYPGPAPASTRYANWIVSLALLILTLLCLGPRFWAVIEQMSGRLSALPSPTLNMTPFPSLPAPPWTEIPTAQPTPAPSETPLPALTWTAAPSATQTSPPSKTPLPARLLEDAQPGERWTSPQDGAGLVFVPAGDFLMGSQDNSAGAEADEMPPHWVSLDSYWIDLNEVTNAMFERFVQATGYVTEAERLGSGSVYGNSGWQEAPGADWRHPQGAESNLDGLENHPVVLVSWNDAAAYCAWAGRRLPSEAEWEKAGRGHLDGALYPWGDAELAGNLANFADASLGTDWAERSVNDGWRLSAPVGSYPGGASPFGLLDMAGNIWEWVQDWYYEGYYAGAPEHAPPGPQRGDRRVLRGGGWSHTWSGIRLAERRADPPLNRSADVGFRCLLDLGQ